MILLLGCISSKGPGGPEPEVMGSFLFFFIAEVFLDKIYRWKKYYGSRPRGDHQYRTVFFYCHSFTKTGDCGNHMSGRHN